jgi:hypothetical protein
VKSVYENEISTPMFIEALFIVIKVYGTNWKCPSADEQNGKRRMWYMYTMKCYSAIQVMKSCHLQQLERHWKS